MALKNIKSIEVIFKRSKLQWLKNIFRKKAKRFPAVATFEGFTGYKFSEAGLMVQWGNSRYFYPMHKLERVKFVTH
ncbi:MAG: hypothetical protein ACRDB3_17745 [Citrobacter telavivensis]